MLSGKTLLLLSTLFFTGMGVCVRFLSDLPFYQIVFFRSLISLVVCVGILRINSVAMLGVDKPRLLFRGASGAGALLLYFLTLKYLPFGLAVTLQYLSPVLTVLVSWVLMKERPKNREIISLGLALICVVIVEIDTISFRSDLLLPLILGLLSAFFSAMAYASIRKLNQTENPLVIVLYFALVTCVLVGPFCVHHWKAPNAMEWLVLFAMGLSSQIAQYFMTKAYQMEPASKIAHVNYLNVVWAILIGFFVWQEHIQFIQFLGIAGILLSSIASTLNLPPSVRKQFSLIQRKRQFEKNI